MRRGRRGHATRHGRRRRDIGADDKLRNKFDEKKGEAKEWVGDHTDNPELADRGRAEQTGAKARQAGEHVKDAVHDAGERLRDAVDDVKDAARRDQW